MIRSSRIIRKVFVVVTGTWTLLASAAAAPSDSALTRIANAGIGGAFREAPGWVGDQPPAQSESDGVARALGTFKTAGEQQGVAAVEGFVESNPASPFTPSLRGELGAYYRVRGHYSRALGQWEQTWESTKERNDEVSRRVGDHALAHWGRLLASLGRLEKLEALIKENSGRIFSDPALAQIWDRTEEAAFHMRTKPGIAYRCGAFALNGVSQALNGIPFAGLWETPSPADGFKLSELKVMAVRHGLDLVPAFRSAGAQFIVPAVVHWKENHYAAITDADDAKLMVQDPTFLSRVWLDSAVVDSEASGYFLVPASVALPAGWKAVTDAEAATVFGKGYPTAQDDERGPECTGDSCEVGPGGGDSGCGMASWKVHEPNINLEVSDIPMMYQAAYGPSFVLNVSWRQRNAEQAVAGHSHFSSGWSSDLLSWVDGDWGWNVGTGEATFYLYMGNGFKYTFVFPAGGATTSV